MKYARIRKLDISNGEGVGVSLFVQGCLFHCKNCFNQETWDFNGGNEWTPEVEEKFFELIAQPFITRVSILGGEPLTDKNVRQVSLIAKKIKEKFPEKKLWVYTGYTYEAIKNKSLGSLLSGSQADDYRDYVLQYADVLVDGPFVEELKDFTLKFRGSSNQRIIDVQESLRRGEVVLWES